MSEKPAVRAIAMWTTLGARTMDVMADGCLCLAQLWDSAWAQGSGDANIKSLGELDEATLEAIQRPAGLLPSHPLDTIGPILNPPAARVTAPKAQSKSKQTPAGKN